MGRDGVDLMDPGFVLFSGMGRDGVDLMDPGFCLALKRNHG